MGCTNTKAKFDAVEDRFRASEDRFRALEARLTATPNEFTHAKVVQVLEEKYGQASRELGRLQKVVELMNQSETLISASKNMMDEAAKLENLSVRKVKAGVQVQVTQVGLVIYYGSRGDGIIYTREGKTFESRIWCDEDDSSCYHATTCIHLTLPGETFTYDRVRSCGEYSTSYRCYFIVLK